MPNFPSIYLELQEIWKNLKSVQNQAGGLDDLQTRIGAAEAAIDVIQEDIANGVAPSGPAGGVLSGDYPNPDKLSANLGNTGSKYLQIQDLGATDDSLENVLAVDSSGNVKKRTVSSIVSAVTYADNAGQLNGLADTGYAKLDELNVFTGTNRFNSTVQLGLISQEVTINPSIRVLLAENVVGAVTYYTPSNLIKAGSTFLTFDETNSNGEDTHLSGWDKKSNAQILIKSSYSIIGNKVEVWIELKGNNSNSIDYASGATINLKSIFDDESFPSARNEHIWVGQSYGFNNTEGGSSSYRAYIKTDNSHVIYLEDSTTDFNTYFINISYLKT